MTDSPEGYSDEHYRHVQQSQSETPYQESEASLDDYPNRQHAWEMGNDPVVDRIAARQMMENPDLTHDYHPSNWNDSQPSIVTGNDFQARAISYTPTWNPSLGYLAQASLNSDEQFPLATPLERDGYMLSAGQLVDSKARQDYAREAYGTLDEIGARYNPNDPGNQHELDVSVDAAFGVMTTAASFNAERQALLRMQSQREANIRAEEARRTAGGAGGSAEGKRHREGGSSPDGQPSKRRPPGDNARSRRSR
ncbi:hypothetical protein ABTZ59_12615 [Streptomyces sp. NPDC094034]|uniref:hypothetical protein n=1 Tax=Streptomyces sp. NPDC094034 TaxID=3155309 RepID=UPI00331D6E8C